MPTRRTMELMVVTIVLAQPALAVVKAWLTKHLATSQSGTGAAAEVGMQIL